MKPPMYLCRIARVVDGRAQYLAHISTTGRAPFGWSLVIRSTIKR